MARRYFPGVDPLGRTLRTGGREHTIVGIIRDGKYDRLDEAPQPYFCLALDQQDFARRVTLVVGTAGDPSALRAQVTRVIRTLEPNLPLSATLTMREFLANAVGEVGGPAYWLTAVGLQALLLAMVGVYGLTSYTVGRRRAEFGVRIALGARPDAIVRLVLRQGLVWTTAGVVLGLLVAFAAAPLLARALFQVGPHDPLVFAVVPLVLAATAIAACYLPARSAARVDPAQTLRSE
jgi:predicted lysophospholipase L1 biosynthesis ABC-type transport system permease subunit